MGPEGKQLPDVEDSQVLTGDAGQELRKQLRDIILGGPGVEGGEWAVRGGV